MVRRLFKHEFYAYLRILFPVWIIFSAVTLIARMMQFLELPEGFLGIPQGFLDMYDVTVWVLNGSAVAFYLAMVLVCASLPVILGVIRYYKNFFTGEGYLTFTLPVTVGQHLFVKITTVLVLELVTVYLLFLSGCVVTSGSLLVEIIKAVWYILVLLLKENGLHVPILFLQMVVAIAVSAWVELLFYQHCITVGQLFPKARLLGAVGVYFGYYLLEQVVATVGMVLFWLAMLFAIPILMALPFAEALVGFVDRYYLYFMHLSIAFSTWISLLSGVFYYVVNYLVIRKRLNLE